MPDQGYLSLNRSEARGHSGHSGHRSRINSHIGPSKALTGATVHGVHGVHNSRFTIAPMRFFVDSAGEP